MYIECTDIAEHIYLYGTSVWKYSIFPEPKTENKQNNERNIEKNYKQTKKK